MGVWARGWFAFGTAVTIATVGLIYARVGKVLIALGLEGPFGGPFNPLLEQVDTIVPILLSAMLVGVAVYVVVGGVQRERTVNRRRPPRR
jgi:hypothetical protein